MVAVPPPPPSVGTKVICPPGIGLSLKYTVPFRLPFFPPHPVAGRNTNRARRTTTARLFAQRIVHMIGPLGAFAKIRNVSLTDTWGWDALARCEAEGAGRAGASPWSCPLLPTGTAHVTSPVRGCPLRPASGQPTRCWHCQ